MRLEADEAPNPAEVRRFNKAMWIVLTLGLLVLAAVFRYSDAPRPVIDRLNPFLGCLVAAAFIVFAHAMWRFRRRCGQWPQKLNTRLKRGK